MFPWQVGQQPALRRRPSWQRHLHRGGHHQAVRGAQGERRDLAGVRRRPQVFAFLSAPVDTPALSLPTSHPPVAVSGPTKSETRAPPRSLPSSRRRRSPPWGVPLPLFAFVSAPLARLLSHRSHPAPRLQYRAQRHQSRGRLRACGHPQGDADHHPEVSHRPRVFASVSAR